jgi:predicted extracellular nuclease
MQYADRNGKQVNVGDVVNVRFEVTNYISDSDTRNLLLRHADQQTGQSDDFRLAVDSLTVESVKSAARADPAPEDPKPEPGPEEVPISATPAA